MLQLCRGIYFWVAHEPKLGAYFFLMMKHKALGGVSETRSNVLKPPSVSPADVTYCSLLFLFIERLSKGPSSAQTNG